KRLRIRHAQQLIAAGLPLAEVAYAVGYSSQSHFTTRFRRIIGVTPGRYRAAMGGGEFRSQNSEATNGEPRNQEHRAQSDSCYRVICDKTARLRALRGKRKTSASSAV
ncbi:helix-turn-helix domain-containing protein, partial [Candidatus Gracilibacteria bacterium]|nr:helix-turn-helix domain-containing protein [Candidatus Gracilibacteria bacterium]